MICICTCVYVCVLVHNVHGTRRRLCCCALSLSLSFLELQVLAFVALLFLFILLIFFLPSSNASVAFHSSSAASAAAANLRVWRITPRGGEEIARRCSGIELNWKGKQKQNLHRLAALLSSPYLPLSLFLRHLCPFILLLQKFSVNVHTHTHTRVQMYPNVLCMFGCVCVCICSCSCRCRLEKTTIASPGKWFRRRRKFNMPYLYFLYALVWALFCAGLRSASALPPCGSLSLFLFVLSFVSICIWL